MRIVIDIEYVYRPEGRHPEVIRGTAEIEGQILNWELNNERENLPIDIHIYSRNKTSYSSLPRQVKMWQYDGTRILLPYLLKEFERFVEC
jgi:hypothetical protein